MVHTSAHPCSNPKLVVTPISIISIFLGWLTKIKCGRDMMSISLFVAAFDDQSIGEGHLGTRCITTTILETRKRYNVTKRKILFASKMSLKLNRLGNNSDETCLPVNMACTQTRHGLSRFVPT